VSDNSKVPTSPPKIGIDVSWSGSGVSASLQSRFTSAIDYLLAGLTEVAGSPVEWIKERMKRKLLLEQDETETLRKIKNIDDSARLDEIQRRANAIKERGEKEQINLEEVVFEAFENISNTSDKDIPESNEEIDQDWLNYFGDYAKKASSDNMRKLWGRILAGEIRKPKSFSRRTLRFLAELDADIALKFEKHAKKCFDGQHILKPEALEGALYEELVFLEDAELLYGVGGFSQLIAKPENNMVLICAENRRSIGNLIIVAESAADIRIPVIKLTRTAQEVASILPPVDQLEVLTEVAKFISRSASNVQIAVITEVMEFQLRYQVIRKI